MSLLRILVLCSCWRLPHSHTHGRPRWSPGLCSDYPWAWGWSCIHPPLRASLASKWETLGLEKAKQINGTRRRKSRERERERETGRELKMLPSWVKKVELLGVLVTGQYVTRQNMKGKRPLGQRHKCRRHKEQISKERGGKQSGKGNWAAGRERKRRNTAGRIRVEKSSSSSHLDRCTQWSNSHLPHVSVLLWRAKCWGEDLDLWCLWPEAADSSGRSTHFEILVWEHYHLCRRGTREGFLFQWQSENLRENRKETSPLRNVNEAWHGTRL